MKGAARISVVGEVIVISDDFSMRFSIWSMVFQTSINFRGREREFISPSIVILKIRSIHLGRDSERTGKEIF